MTPDQARHHIQVAVKAAALHLRRCGVPVFAIHAFAGIGDQCYTAFGDVEHVCPHDLAEMFREAAEKLEDGSAPIVEVK